MTEDSIRVTAGRPTSTGGAPAGRRGAGLPVPSELLVLAALILAVLIAAAVDDGFGATTAWGFVTVLGAAFILSRGLTKHGRADDGL